MPTMPPGLAGTIPVYKPCPGRNFQFCTHGIVIYIVSIYQKSVFFSLLKKFSPDQLFTVQSYLFLGTFANAI